MRTRRRFGATGRARAAAALLSVALVAAACSGDDDDSSGGAPAPATDGGSGAPATEPEGAPSTDSEGTPATEPEGAPTTDDAGDEPEAGEPKSGGSLVFAFNTMAPSLDPAIVAARATDAGQWAYPVFGSLVNVDYETITQLETNFLESIETSDSGSTWTLTVREGIRFSDGEPFDAAAIEYNWNRYLEKAAQPSTGAQRIESIEVTGPLTLQVSLKQPTAQWPFLLGSLNFIGSPKAIEELGDEFGVRPVGAGPFILEEFVSDQSMRFVRNSDYWEPGKPYLDELTIVNMPDGSRRTDAMLTGEADMGLPSPNAYDRIEAAGFVRLPVMNVPSFGGSGIVFNSVNPPFDRHDVRCAVIQAIDFEAFIDQMAAGNAVVGDDGKPMNSFVHRGPAREAAHRYPGFDREAAQAVFDAYAAETGEPVRFTIHAIDSAALEAEWYITQFQTFDNIEATLETKTVAELIQFVLGGNHHMAQLGWGSSDVPAAWAINQYGHSLPDGSANKWTGFTSPEWDDAIERATEGATEEERLQGLIEAQDVIVDECLFTPTPRAGIGVLWGKADVQGVFHTTVSTAWEEVWLDR